MFERSLTLTLCIIVALAGVTVCAQEPRPVVPVAGNGDTTPALVESAGDDERPAGASTTDDVYFLATSLTPDLEGTAPGQIDPHGAEFYNNSLYVVEPNSAISAYTLPFSGTTRVWVEYRNMPYTATVYFNSVEGYGLGNCEIASAGTARLWGYCEHDPLGDYVAAEVIVAAPQGASIYGIVAARPESWESPKYYVFVPVLQRGN